MLTAQAETPPVRWGLPLAAGLLPSGAQSREDGPLLLRHGSGGTPVPVHLALNMGFSGLPA